jgi:hypothetical protein
LPRQQNRHHPFRKFHHARLNQMLRLVASRAFFRSCVRFTGVQESFIKNSTGFYDFFHRIALSSRSQTGSGEHHECAVPMIFLFIVERFVGTETVSPTTRDRRNRRERPRSTSRSGWFCWD